MKFGSNKKDSESTHAQKVTVLSLGFELTGDVVSKNDIRADGILRGNIRTDKKVVVGEKAYIEGDVWADEISISGEIAGDLYINGDTTIHASAKVSGNILTHKVFIQQGATINSSIRTADAATIQKEKDSLEPLPSSIQSTLSRRDEKEEVRAERITPVVEEVKREKTEDVPPVSRDFPRSW